MTRGQTRHKYRRQWNLQMLSETWSGPEKLNGSSLFMNNFSFQRCCQQKYDESVSGGRAREKESFSRTCRPVSHGCLVQKYKSYALGRLF